MYYKFDCGCIGHSEGARTLVWDKGCKSHEREPGRALFLRYSIRDSGGEKLPAKEAKRLIRGEKECSKKQPAGQCE